MNIFLINDKAELRARTGSKSGLEEFRLAEPGILVASIPRAVAPLSCALTPLKVESSSGSLMIGELCQRFFW